MRNRLERWIRRYYLLIPLIIGITFCSAITVWGYNSYPWGADIPKPANGFPISPAGKQIMLGDRPYGMTKSPDGKTLIVSNNGQSTQSLMIIDVKTGKVVQTISYKSPEALYIGVIYSPDGSKLYASAGGNNKIRVFDVHEQKVTETNSIYFPKKKDSSGNSINYFPAGIAISQDGHRLFTANNLDDSVSMIDLDQQKVVYSTHVGKNPYSTIISKSGAFLYASNWGENTVSVISIDSKLVINTIQVGSHPSAMKMNLQRNELYVANTDSDSISVIDTQLNQVIRVIGLSPYPTAPTGSSPNALTVSEDGNFLYIANAGNNDIAVVRLAEENMNRTITAKDTVAGYIPTGWYPTAVELSADHNQLYVVNAKGFGAGPNRQGPNPESTHFDEFTTDPNQFSGSMIKGSLSIINIPDTEQLKSYSMQVTNNDGFDQGNAVRNPDLSTISAIPHQLGEPSPIKHVIYIIKENRTYDQIYGSLEKGDGDPSLNLFGEESAPNQRQLSRQFVTLDHFYADAEVSADGWNWSTAATANSYVQKNWPSTYSDRNRPYDYEGGNHATSPGATPEKAFLWNHLALAGISYRNYGMFIYYGMAAAGDEPNLGQNTDFAYPGYNITIKDQSRADEWMKEFKLYEQNQSLPAVELLRLPSDHTSATKPGAPTPRAMMADNDLALGRIVEAVSHSSYWKDTAIFVVEDDAQNGADHIDSHRTAALVISPYTQTGKVDSTSYTTSSMLRTIELILGVEPMTQFDAAAVPMFNSFTDQPNFTLYKVIKPTQSLSELNNKHSPMADLSERMNLAMEDRVPENQFNAAIWKSIKGNDSEMPTIHSKFADHAVKVDLE